MNITQAEGDKPTSAFRASILHCLARPDPDCPSEAVEYIADGILLVREGCVAALGEATDMLAKLPDAVTIQDWRGHLLVPGFIDTHVHYPQTDIVASHGEQLLDWLEKYVLPDEARFDDPDVCAETARFFLDELARNGTTTACVFATVHPASVDALLQAALERGLRMVAGKVLMDRNCPDTLCEASDSGMRHSLDLIERWHGKGRLAYALTPRFAPTSSGAQLAAVGEMLDANPGLYLQTHMAETARETAWVAELFPEATSYLDVYERAGLIRPRSVLAHCIHIGDSDRQRLAARDASIAFCPSSNLFLGSGLFDYVAARDAGIRLGLGTDIGAGTAFGIPATAGEAYKVCRMAGGSMGPFEAFYLATLGGARALHMDDVIGNFHAGKEADFVLLDYNATPLLARRTGRASRLEEKLFALMVLGDDRMVAATYILGEQAHVRN